ncbi:MAG: hypothetical protein Q4F60_00840 [Candidatus Saccharibacteria bacterium]|nr:hypothetical protein [Candidatus Saccharibacteria bacterium]
MQAFSTFEKFVLFAIVAVVAAIAVGIMAMRPILYQLNAYMALG